MQLKKLAALLLALCLLPAGCKKEEEVPPTAPPTPSVTVPAETTAAPGVDDVFTVCWAPEGGFNPFSCTEDSNRLLLPLLYEGLFTLDGAFQAQNQLCESYTVSEDGLDWLFQLRADIQFSDGSSLSGEDVAASLRAARKSQAYAGRFGGIESISVAGKDTVRISLSAPNRRLPCLLDIPIVKSGTQDDALPTGTGPYTYNAGEKPRLSAGSYHRDFQTLPLESIYLTDADSESLHTDFEQGLLDLFVTDPHSSRNPSFRGNHELRHFCTTDLYYLGFNMAPGRWFSGEAARKDINAALDRGVLAQNVFEGCLTPAPLLLHPMAAGYDQSAAARYDLRNTDLKAYFQERLMGDYDGDGLLESYENGAISDFAVDFIVCKSDERKLTAARSLTKSLTDAGYPITMRELEREDFLKALDEGDFDLYLAETILSPDFDLRPLLATGGSLNYGQLSDSWLDKLLADDLAAGEENAAQAEQAALSYIADKAYVLPIGFLERGLYSHHGVIRGLDPAANNVFYGIADWTVSLGAE